MSNLRFCLTCPSYSQAGICHYTLLGKIPDEPTFEPLRYSLGGSRPKQTTSYTMSSFRMSEKKIYEWFSKDA